MRCQTYGYLPNYRIHCPVTGAKLYCLVIEAHGCEQLAQGSYFAVEWPGVKLATPWVRSHCLALNHYATGPPDCNDTYRACLPVCCCCVLSRIHPPEHFVAKYGVDEVKYVDEVIYSSYIWATCHCFLAYFFYLMIRPTYNIIFLLMNCIKHNSLTNFIRCVPKEHFWYGIFGAS